MKNPKLAKLNNSSIKTFRALSDSEFTTIESAVNRLREFSANQNLLDVVEINHDEFSKSTREHLEKYASRKKVSNLDDFSPNFLRTDLNRLFINFLSSFRMYLDHHETNLKRTYGEKSKEYINYKKVCSVEYDANFAYRFFYKLRNYAQHCGFPIGSIGWSSNLDEINPRKVHHSLSIKFDVNELINKFDDWGALKDELLAMPTEFNVHPLMNSLMPSLNRINKQLYTDEVLELVDSAKVLDHLLKELENEPGELNIIDIERSETTNDIRKADLLILPINIIELVKTTFPERF